MQSRIKSNEDKRSNKSTLGTLTKIQLILWPNNKKSKLRPVLDLDDFIRGFFCTCLFVVLIKSLRPNCNKCLQEEQLSVFNMLGLFLFIKVDLQAYIFFFYRMLFLMLPTHFSRTGIEDVLHLN